MKRNSSLCFLVNIGLDLFCRADAAPAPPARLDIAQTVNERYMFALRSASLFAAVSRPGNGHTPLLASGKAASRGSMAGNQIVTFSLPGERLPQTGWRRGRPCSIPRRRRADGPP
jgi:hypothetical protein